MQEGRGKARMRYSDVSSDEMYEGDDRAVAGEEVLEDCQGLINPKETLMS